MLPASCHFRPRPTTRLVTRSRPPQRPRDRPRRRRASFDRRGRAARSRARSRDRRPIDGNPRFPRGAVLERAAWPGAKPYQRDRLSRNAYPERHVSWPTKTSRRPPPTRAIPALGHPAIAAGARDHSSRLAAFSRRRRAPASAPDAGPRERPPELARAGVDTTRASRRSGGVMTHRTTDPGPDHRRDAAAAQSPTRARSVHTGSPSPSRAPAINVAGATHKAPAHEVL